MPLKQIQMILEESPAINICKELLEEGLLVIHDPKVSSKQIDIDLNLKPIEITIGLKAIP